MNIVGLMEDMFDYCFEKFVPLIIKDLELEDVQNRISIRCSDEIITGSEEDSYILGKNTASGTSLNNNSRYFIKVMHEEIIIYTHALVIAGEYNIFSIERLMVITLAHEFRHSYQVKHTNEIPELYNTLKEKDCDDYAENFVNKYKNYLRYFLTQFNLKKCTIPVYKGA
jgi:hypothetical protein